ncbi:unnamed protein product [Diamesa tonsa]
MENYKKGKNVEEELTQEQIPIENLPEKFLWMHVKGGTKVPNVVEFAEKAFKDGVHRSVVWSGSGGGVTKTISSAEIMKRNFKVQQVTHLAYQKIEEYWEPVLKGLEPIVVTRQVPAIHILLSLDEIDAKTIGLQKSNEPTKFWLEPPPPGKQPTKQNEDYIYNKNRKTNNKDRRERNGYNNGQNGSGQAPSSSNGQNKNNNNQKGNKSKKPRNDNSESTAKKPLETSKPATEPTS